MIGTAIKIKVYGQSLLKIYDRRVHM